MSLLDILVRPRRASAGAEPAPHSDNGRYQHDLPGPNGTEPVDRVPPDTPKQAAPDARTFKRGQLRRRLRYLRQLRELQLRDIGGFLVECRRFGRRRPDLVEAKVEEALEIDHEVRAIERALGIEHPLEDVRQPGIGGACPECGSVFGSGDRFCAWCGHRI